MFQRCWHKRSSSVWSQRRPCNPTDMLLNQYLLTFTADARCVAKWSICEVVFSEILKVPTQTCVEIGLMLQTVTVNFVLFRLLCFLIFVIWRRTVLQLIKILAVPCGRRYPQHRRLSLWCSISGKLVPFNWKTRCKDKSHNPLPSRPTDSFGKARGISPWNPCCFISDGSVVTATSCKITRYIQR